ncbi:MAG: DUF2723 domain-containing protein [Candidatus Eremiobacteraeota bacterium]|nr:DUF2723 domain-containing protein [Candidatus Eremiobacteraeota bacterium]
MKWIALLVPAVIYALSASHEPGSWDTAELQGVPFILGISHPTGFPFYVLAGYVWSHAVALDTVAWRMNVMSGMAVAVACTAAYATARLLGARRLIALTATLWFAVTPNIWSHASRAEAQDVAFMCATLGLYAMLRWMKGDSTGWFVAAFALCGLGIAAHPNALWIFPALIVGAVAGHRGAARQRARAPLLVALAAFVAAILLYAYLPLRSAYVVARAVDPTQTLPGAGGGIFWNYNDPRRLDGLVRELSGSEFQTPAYLAASFNPIHFFSAPLTFLTDARAQYGTVGAVAILVGLVVSWRRDRRATLVLLLAAVTGLVFSVIYPNESDVERYRLLVPWVAVPFLAALAPRRFAGKPRLTDAFHALLIVLFVLAAAWNVRQHAYFFSHAAGEGGRWVIDAVRPYVGRNDVIVTGWLDATSLAYGAYVDGSLRERIVVSDNSLRLGLYELWARRHRVFVLLDPHGTKLLPGAQDFARIDDYHELYLVER